MQDATYYDGHYYLYYGVAPLVTLMLPFRLITGADLPIALATFCFSCGGLLVSLVLWQMIREKYFRSTDGIVTWAGILILGVTNLVPVLLRRTLVYELPIASGYFYSMLTMLALFLCLHSVRHTVLWGVVASFSLGLAVASRLTYLFTIPVLLIPLYWLWREKAREGNRRIPWGMVAAAVLPIASIGMLMAVYNYKRYGQFGEFGTSYQIAEMVYLAKMQNFDIGHVPFNFVNYLFATPDLSAHYPYFLFPGVWHWSIHPLPDCFGPELVPGLLICFPVSVFAFFSFFACVRDVRRLLPVLCCIWGLLVGTFGCMLVFHAGIVRYMIDFTPSLMMCAAIGLLVVDGWVVNCRSFIVKNITKIFCGGILLISIIMVVMFSLELHGTFRAVNPYRHARVALFFEKLSFWNKQLPGRVTGPLEISICPMETKPGRTEPLLATGFGNSSESVFLRWTDGDSMVVGYQHGLGRGARKLSEPISVKKGAIYRVCIDLGSLYTEKDDHSCMGMDSSGLDRLRQRWQITVEGKVVLQGDYNGVSSVPAGEFLFLGCNPNIDEFGKRLFVSIQSVKNVSQ